MGFLYSHIIWIKTFFFTTANSLVFSLTLLRLKSLQFRICVGQIVKNVHETPTKFTDFETVISSWFLVIIKLSSHNLCQSYLTHLTKIILLTSPGLNLSHPLSHYFNKLLLRRYGFHCFHLW